MVMWRGSGWASVNNARLRARLASGKARRALKMTGWRMSSVRSQKSRAGAAISFMLLWVNGM